MPTLFSARTPSSESALADTAFSEVTITAFAAGKEHLELLDLFPLLANATARTAVLTPGDVLFIPSNWWHYTRSIDHSITLSYNFFNEANLAQFMESLIKGIPDFAGRHGVPQEALAKINKSLAKLAAIGD